jgi:molybdenum cofactor cytidylyltransferase
LAHAVRETAGADGWLFALADMPWVSVAAIRALAAAIDTPDRTPLRHSMTNAATRSPSVRIGRPNGPPRAAPATCCAAKACG